MNDKDFLYDIERLDCFYEVNDKNGKKNKRTVLSVRYLTIPRNKITFILGASGSGKSTFMEAVGLMSNTIEKDHSKKVHYKQDDGEIYDLVEDVDTDDNTIKVNKSLDSFRFDNFSFIFQATNLMVNFSAKENVALTDYINYPIIAEFFALKRLEEILKISDPFEKNPGEYSGGQRQRFAFARALGARANVLFGDEPTGNLDEVNSTGVLKILQDIIKENVEDENAKGKIRNAIIVSHSNELALNFADQIVIIIAPENLEDKKGNKAEDNQNLNPDAGMGKTNNLFVYKKENGEWPGGQIQVKKEISFFLNYHLVKIHEEFVNISEKLISEIPESDLNGGATAYSNFHRFITMFVANFYNADERVMNINGNINNIISNMRVAANIDSRNYDSCFENLVMYINEICNP